MLTCPACAVVTGSAKGTGRAIAEKLASCGAEVEINRRKRHRRRRRSHTDRLHALMPLRGGRRGRLVRLVVGKRARRAQAAPARRRQRLELPLWRSRGMAPDRGMA